MREKEKRYLRLIYIPTNFNSNDKEEFSHEISTRLRHAGVSTRRSENIKGRFFKMNFDYISYVINGHKNIEIVVFSSSANRKTVISSKLKHHRGPE